MQVVKKFLKHILEAKKSGADIVKIQTYEPKDITLKEYKNKFKIKKGIWKNKYLWDLYKKAQTPFWHEDAFKLAKKTILYCLVRHLVKGQLIY